MTRIRMRPSHLFGSNTAHIAPMRSSLVFLFSLLLLLLTPLVSASWFTSCVYHTHALQQIRLRLEHVVGQEYATSLIYSHLQHHLETYESVRHANSARAASANEEAEGMHSHISSTPLKPLVLSFHGPTGTGKSLTANSVASALFFRARSSHIHTYHGSDFSGSTPNEIQDSIEFLKSEFVLHTERCPLSIFIIEEIHMMAPGVLEGLRHLMDAGSMNKRVKIRVPLDQAGATYSQSSATAADPLSDATTTDERSGGNSATTSTPGTKSVVVNFSHAIFLFTTNIGSEYIQAAAYNAAKDGVNRAELPSQLLQDVLLKSLNASPSLRVLHDTSFANALVPFFPLFKSHVKQCVNVQLEIRKRNWEMKQQIESFAWDKDSVPNYTSSLLKYKGPISIYGCKNVNEILTQTLLLPLTRTFRDEYEEQTLVHEAEMRDLRIPKREKVKKFAWKLWDNLNYFFTGPRWNYADTNITMKVEQQQAGGSNVETSVVFELTEFIDENPGSSDQPRRTQTRELRQVLDFSGATDRFHHVPETKTPTKHASLEQVIDAAELLEQKDEL